jgi:phage baseplate assembly protein W
MSNLLRRFNKQVIGSDGRIYDYVSKITASGDFKRVSDLDVIITSWNNILLTPKRTYLHDPNYGSNLHKLIFEPVDDTTVERIKSEVIDSLSIYDSRASIENVAVYIKPNRKGYQVDIEVEYEGERGTLSVSFDDSTVIAQQSSTGGGVPLP